MPCHPFLQERRVLFRRETTSPALRPRSRAHFGTAFLSSSIQGRDRPQRHETSSPARVSLRSTLRTDLKYGFRPTPTQIPGTLPHHEKELLGLLELFLGLCLFEFDNDGCLWGDLLSFALSPAETLDALGANNSDLLYFGRAYNRRRPASPCQIHRHHGILRRNALY